MGGVVFIMAKGLSYKEVFDEAPDSFVVAEVVRRNSGNRFAEGFQIMRKCASKSDADKWLAFAESQGIEACIIPTFEEGGSGIQMLVVGGNVEEVGSLFEPSDYARFFRVIYGLSLS